MKRIIRMLLTLSMLITIAACSGNDLTETEVEIPPQIAEEAPPEPTAPELELDNQQPYLENIEIWNYENFINIREPVQLLDDTPYGDVAMSHLAFMSDNLYHRAAFSYRELETAVWIVEELLSMGFAWDDIKIQEFTRQDIVHWKWGLNWTDLQQSGSNRGVEFRQISQNIILTIPGQSEQTIIITAHYDSVITPGANDNASGTALLLESAQRMRSHNNYYTMVYAFLGAHEIGRIGSHYYFESLSEQERENILFMFSADVILGTHFRYGAGFIENSEHAENFVSMKVHEIADNLRANYDVELASFNIRPHTGGDEFVFSYAGHTVVAFLAWNLDEYGMFFGYYGHTEYDCIHHYNEIMPGMAERAMWFFSMFLEKILLASY